MIDTSKMVRATWEDRLERTARDYGEPTFYRPPEGFVFEDKERSIEWLEELNSFAAKPI